MKIRVMPQELVRHISQVQRAISSRTTMQILECIRFEAKEGKLVLMGTDLELSIQTSMPCQVIEEGVVVIPSSMIGNIFRKLPPAAATLEETNGIVVIECLDSHFTLQVPGAGEYPDLPEMKREKATNISNDVLIRAISETEFATSLDESKVALTGIYYERRAESARLVTLDGYRMALRNLPLAEDQEAFEESMIVPKRAMMELSRILDNDGMTTICAFKNHILFESGSVRLFARLIDKSFISYEEIISEDYSTKVVMDRQAFRDAVERASLLTQGERAHLIRLNFQPNGLMIESNSEIGHVNEFVKTEMSGDGLMIAFNATYLLEGVRALSSEQITLYLNGTLNPMIIRPTEDESSYLYLVLPVRVAGE